MKTELCCFSLSAAKLAEHFKLDRIELCGGFLEGGTTPSLGLVKQVLSACDHTEVHVMLRPRGGDFTYDKSEIDVCLADIEILKTYQPSGFVFGALAKDGKVDILNCQKIVEAAAPFPVTFHRAIDVAVNPLEAVKVIGDLGFRRILSSGQQSRAIDGIALLQLMKDAEPLLEIMAGSGVTAENIDLFKQAGLDAVHFTAKEFYTSDFTSASAVNFALDYKGYGRYEPNPEEIKAIIQKI